MANSRQSPRPERPVPVKEPPETEIPIEEPQENEPGKRKRGLGTARKPMQARYARRSESRRGKR